MVGRDASGAGLGVQSIGKRLSNRIHAPSRTRTGFEYRHIVPYLR